MTSRDFIKKTYQVPSDRERHCSSVFTDYDGNVYSYGYHYPLLFRVGGLDFVNDRGYSVTTAKHIGWAHSAIDYTGISVELPSHIRYPRDLTLEDIRKMLFKQHTAITDQMLAKKRKDTQVYKQLEWQASRIAKNLATVTEAM